MEIKIVDFMVTVYKEGEKWKRNRVKRSLSLRKE